MNLYKLIFLIGFSIIVHHSLAQQNETPVAGSPYNPHPGKVVVTEVKHFDNMCWKIATANGTLYYENGKTAGKVGFSSAFDQVGNDWIGNDADKGYNTSPKGSNKHEYRGWPNFGNGNFDHPQRASSGQTKWVDKDCKDVAFNGRLEGDHLIMRSSNSVYELEYHFFTTHAAIKVIKASDKYAFLFEGPIGGEMEATTKDKWIFKDGSENKTLCNMTSCASPYIYFVDTDPKDTQVWYIGTANLNSGIGGESYVQASNMVVVSFGRTGTYPNDTRKLTGTDAVCVFGFHEKADHKIIDEFITARLKTPYASGVSVATSFAKMPLNSQAFQIKVTGNTIYIDTKLASEYHVEIFNVHGKLVDSWKASGYMQRKFITTKTTRHFIFKVKTKTTTHQQMVVMVK